MGKKWKLTAFIFLGSKMTADIDWSHKIKRRLLLGIKAMTNLESILKSRDITLPRKFCVIRVIVFSSSHIWMWELDHKEGWAPKTWCLWIVVKKIPENPLNRKEIILVNPKGNQPWILIVRTDTEPEVETPVLQPPNAKTVSVE